LSLEIFLYDEYKRAFHDLPFLFRGKYKIGFRKAWYSMWFGDLKFKEAAEGHNVGEISYDPKSAELPVKGIKSWAKGKVKDVEYDGCTGAGVHPW
jgi:hypothetical protein